MSAPEPDPGFNKTKCGYIALLTYLNYETWKETTTLVLEAMDTYNIITREESELPPIDINYHECKNRVSKAKSKIYHSCSPNIPFLLKGLRSPKAMWSSLQVPLESSGTHIIRTTIQCKFQACHLQEDQTVTEYFTILPDYHLELISTPQAISDDEMCTHIHNNMLKKSCRHV